MNQPSQEDLLGYVLGALEAQEHRQLQQQIDDNPELEEKLLAIKSSLVPLDYLDTTGPRPGLARRTCEAVAVWEPDSPEVATRLAFLNQLEDHSTEDARDSVAESTAASDDVVDQDVHGVHSVHSTQITSPDKPAPAAMVTADLAEPGSLSRRRDRQFLRPASWAMTDVLVGVASLAILVSLLFPAVSWQRYRSRLLACQNNLQQVGTAFMLYSSANGGQFVSIPDSGNLSTAGCFGPILKDSGFLEDDNLLACAGVASPKPVFIPTVDQVLSAQSRAEIEYYRHHMGGHYGYTMGYRQGDGHHYQAPRSVGQSNVVLLADRPSADQPGRVSLSHGGKGQNCLMADGHVRYVSGHAIGGDALFENDYGVVAPGYSESDNVIAPSHLAPAIGIQVSVSPAE